VALENPYALLIERSHKHPNQSILLAPSYFSELPSNHSLERPTSHQNTSRFSSFHLTSLQVLLYILSCKSLLLSIQTSNLPYIKQLRIYCYQLLFK